MPLANEMHPQPVYAPRKRSRLWAVECVESHSDNSIQAMFTLLSDILACLGAWFCISHGLSPALGLTPLTSALLSNDAGEHVPRC